MRWFCTLAFLALGVVPVLAQETDRDAAVRLAREALAKDLEVPASSISITVKEVEATEWTDSALGCGEATAAGAPTQMPGWRVVLSVAGRTYPVHVGGNRAVRCMETGAPDAAKGPVPRSDQRPGEARGRILNRVRADLARRLGIDVADVKLKSMLSTTWPDQSLGCPEPDQMYAQVLTEGQRIELEAGGQTYRYHTSGKRFVYCSEPAEK